MAGSTRVGVDGGGVTSRPRAASSSALQSAKPVSSPVVTARPRPLPRPLPKKQVAPPKPEPEKPALPTDDQEDDSDLTSLSSTRQSLCDEVDNAPRAPPAKKSSPVRPASSQSLPSASTSAFPFQSISRLSKRDEVWKVTELGKYVWVLINEKEPRVFDLEDEDDGKKERIWWPGKIQGSSKNIPLKITLFGFEHPNVKIRNPSERNILSRLDSYGRNRFPNATFVSSSTSEDNVLTSPRKKKKRNVEGRWNAAVQAMLRELEDLEGSDHMPTLAEAYTYAHLYSASSTAKGSPSKNKGKGKRPFTEEDDEVELSTWDRWSPPPADPDIDIPGELVLAKEKPTASLYWPAKVLQYVEPKSRKETEGKYKVVYLDGLEQAIPRQWFWTSIQDEFATCKLGEFQSAHDDDVNDSDSEDAIMPPRSPSPLPSSPVPSPSDFAELSIRHQFVYTKPVLQAILNEQYPPAKGKHDAFIAGGKLRNSVAEGAGQRGKMDPSEVTELQVLVSAWCLRDGVRAMKLREEEGEENEGGDAAQAELEALNKTVEIKVEDTPPNDERSGSPARTEEMSPSPHGLPPESSFSPTDVSMERDSSAEPEASLLTVTSAAKEQPENVGDGIDDTLSDLTGVDSSPEVAPTPPPQQGCEAYHALSGVEKVDYCLNVLLPEAILQILLWRSGDRTSPKLLSLDEEQDLHDKGEELLRETDWVFDVMRLRGLKAKQLKKKEEKEERKRMMDGGWSGSQRARPKRNGRVPDYRE